MNPNLARLPENYLFAEIARRIGGRKVLDLSVGDTTCPLPKCIAERMSAEAKTLSTERYAGYGPAYGLPELREAIARVIYRGQLDPDEIFISDGAKSDLARLMHLFARGSKLAIQDPAYPAYVEAAIIAGHQPVPLSGTFPTAYPPCDAVLLCSPNNPTGAVAGHRDFATALAVGCPVINDAAYAAFIASDAPKSIFEVEGARARAIEVGSFSKLAGFTGVRLGWTAIARQNALYAGWKRIMSTLFNGASRIAQAGGLACLEPRGWQATQEIIAYYRENARILAGEPVDAPYVWLAYPGRSSWEVFDQFLELGIAVTPGVGFGSGGEGFVRLSAFGFRSDVEQAAKLLSSLV